MRRHSVVGVLGLFLLAGLALRADDGAAKRPSGTWERKAGDQKIKFEFKKDEFHCTVNTNDGSIVINADFGVTKDGTLFGIVTKVERNGANGGPSEGDLFSFKVTQEKDTLVIKDLKGSSGTEESRPLVEGEYKQEVK